MKKLFCLVPLIVLTACGGSNLPVVINKTCSIDAPAVNSTLESTKNFSVSGWVFDNQSGALPEGVSVQLVSADRQSSKVFDTTFGGKRPDVAKFLNIPAAESSGFTVEVPAQSVVPGNYEIVILQKFKNVFSVCSNSSIVTIK